MLPIPQRDESSESRADAPPVIFRHVQSDKWPAALRRPILLRRALQLVLSSRPDARPDRKPRTKGTVAPSVASNEYWQYACVVAASVYPVAATDY